MTIFKKNKNQKGIELEDYLFSITEKESSRIEFPLEKNKLNFFWIVIFISLLILGGKIFYLNVIKGSYYREIARENSIRSIPIKAPRGKILDRFGNILVNNIPSIDVIFIPTDLPKEQNELKKISLEISKVLSLNEGDVLAKFSSTDSRSLSPLLLKENITQEEYLMFEENKINFPGVFTDKTAIREYPDSSIFSHIIGYIGKIDKRDLNENQGYLMTDYVGKQGIEKSYEKYLRGKNGGVKMEVDSLGNIKTARGIIPPETGKDLILGIDYDLQKQIYDRLTDILEKTNSKTAAAVAIDPQNGEVRALVSLPSFDNNLFSGKISQENYLSLINDPNKPLFNRAISGEYPPGSTIKPIVAIAALSEGIISESTTVNCNGSISIGSYTFRDWKNHGPGIDVKKAIAESCDVFFYSIGGGYGNVNGLGIERMARYERLFGLGEKTKIDIPGETNGFIPSKEWKLEKIGEKWYTGNDYHASIGQGFVTSTALQVANSIATIANGGTLYEPRIVSKIIDENQEIIDNSSVVVRSNFISPQALKIVQEGMRQTVLSGSAKSLGDLSINVAGKTGTAQFWSEDKTHAWFVSYAPYENPELAMVVLVEGGGEGSSSAVPVTKEVYKWYFDESRKNGD